jgi:hypothetical protein
MPSETVRELQEVIGFHGQGMLERGLHDKQIVAVPVQVMKDRHIEKVQPVRGRESSHGEHGLGADHRAGVEGDQPAVLWTIRLWRNDHRPAPVRQRDLAPQRVDEIDAGGTKPGGAGKLGRERGDLRVLPGDGLKRDQLVQIVRSDAGVLVQQHQPGDAILNR